MIDDLLKNKKLKEILYFLLINIKVNYETFQFVYLKLLIFVMLINNKWIFKNLKIN